MQKKGNDNLDTKQYFDKINEKLDSLSDEEFLELLYDSGLKEEIIED